MVWTHRSLDMYRWHPPKHHSSPKYPFAHPSSFKDKVEVFVHIKHSVPWWAGTAVELEAKGQASAQSTTGTVTLGANKKKKMYDMNDLILGYFGNFRHFGILGYFGHFKVMLYKD